MGERDEEQREVRDAPREPTAPAGVVRVPDGLLVDALPGGGGLRWWPFVPLFVFLPLRVVGSDGNIAALVPVLLVLVPPIGAAVTARVLRHRLFARTSYQPAGPDVFARAVRWHLLLAAAAASPAAIVYALAALPGPSPVRVVGLVVLGFIGVLVGADLLGAAAKLRALELAADLDRRWRLLSEPPYQPVLLRGPGGIGLPTVLGPALLALAVAAVLGRLALGVARHDGVLAVTVAAAGAVFAAVAIGWLAHLPALWGRGLPLARVRRLSNGTGLVAVAAVLALAGWLGYALATGSEYALVPLAPTVLVVCAVGATWLRTYGLLREYQRHPA